MKCGLLTVNVGGFLPSADEPTAMGIQASLAIRSPTRRLSVSGVGAVVAAGLGWDADNPLRPWPWLSRKPGERSGATYYCLSCCGVWAGVRCQWFPWLGRTASTS